MGVATIKSRNKVAQIIRPTVLVLDRFSYVNYIASAIAIKEEYIDHPFFFCVGSYWAVVACRMDNDAIEIAAGFLEDGDARIRCTAATARAIAMSR